MFSASRLVASIRRPGAAQQPVGQLGSCVDQVLAVVQRQQQPPTGQVLGQPGGRGIPGPALKAQRSCHRLGDQRHCAQLVQADQPDTIRKRPLQTGRGPQRQPGLADPADPGQCHQMRPGQQAPYLGQLIAAADEAGQLGRQVTGPAAARCHNM
jgi:hypothetical protein